MDPLNRPSIQHIAFIGNYAPRQCGIATFTTDLVDAIRSRYPETKSFTIAMNDIDGGYAYPSQVRFEIEQDNLEAYQRAADYLNLNSVDIISLQHEYGIFGGKAGSHIITFLRSVKMPVVTTLHTILKGPDPDQFKVMKELAELSNQLVVMSRRGEEFLRTIYGIPEDKIRYIPHGIPDIPFIDPNYYKDHFDVEGKFVILTFGLLSRNKGIENVIKALPQVVKRHPEVIYLVLGATHPAVLRHEGDAYRKDLQETAQQLGVSQNVRFINQFVSLPELVEYIGAADLYITPYLNPQQITSGTLAYTAGAGKAVISTPYWYAEELLAGDKGVLVPFSDPQAIGNQINTLIENEPLRHAMRKKAYLQGREMVWPKIAEQYMDTFEKARLEPLPRSHKLFTTTDYTELGDTLPPLNLYHLTRMMDNTGLMQHAIYTLPNYREGYTTDDNARALMVAVLLERLGDDWFTGAEELGSRYLSFLWYAFHSETGRFRNFLGFDRQWLEKSGSEDAHGRALWSLGLTAGHSNHDALRSVSGILFNQALPVILSFTSPRAWAFSLLGITEYLKRFRGDRLASQTGIQLSQRLVDLYVSISSPDWCWFENSVTYNNATLSHALLASGNWLNRDDFIQIGLESLTWLTEVQTSQGVFAPIGNNGFYLRGTEKPAFDQQPIEAYATVAACAQAYQLTKDLHWKGEAKKAFDWFMGANLLGLPLYNPQSGGCKDGLQPDRVNQNEGAESTLSYHLSLLEMRMIDQMVHAKGDLAPITLLSIQAHLGPD